jgi:hypothetical protein
MFIRKLYYDLATGEVLSSHMRQGSVRMTTFDEDVAALPELAGRTEADTGCMVWESPDAETETAFAAASGVSVDVTQTPHALVFDYTPAVVEPDPVEVMEAALNEMGVMTRE